MKFNHPPEYQVGQAFQPDFARFTVRLESLTYDSFDILAGGCEIAIRDQANRSLGRPCFSRARYCDSRRCRRPVFPRLMNMATTSESAPQRM